MRPDPRWRDLPLRPEVAAAEPYGAPQLDVPVKLNVNENPYPPSPAIRQAMAEAVARAAGQLNRYPDREALELRRRLAVYLGHGLGPDQVWAANGSNEIMIQILLAFAGPGRRVLNFTPSYSMYPEYARDTHSDYVTSPRTADFQIDPVMALAAVERHQPGVVVVARPNNPTGTPTDLGVIAALARASAGMVVVDEAYQEFSNQPSALDLLPQYGNLIVARTMSKAFAFAGGRVGYAAAHAAVIDALRVVRLPYHLSSVTQAVAAVALEQAEAMLANVAELVRTRDAVIPRLRRFGLTVVDSQANFILFGPFTDRHQVWTDLVERGILVRETGPAGYLRVSIGTPDEMERFLAALAEIMKGLTR